MNHNAMYNSHPSVASIRGNECFDIDGNPVAVDQSAYEAEAARLQAEYDSNAYARARAESYASIGDQLDMQYHDSVNGSRTWLDHIESVKDAHPK